MIFGFCTKGNPADHKAKLERACAEKQAGRIAMQGHAGFVFNPDLPNTEQKRQSGIWQSQEDHTLVLFQGHVFNEDEIRRAIGASKASTFPEVVYRAYSKNSVEGFSKFNGHFAIVIYEQDDNRLILARDHFGVEPLFYYEAEDTIIFSSIPQGILDYADIPREINYKGVYAYLLFNYVPIKETLIANVYKLFPAHQLSWHDGETKISRYWDLQFAQNEDHDESYFSAKILELLNDSVAIRLDQNGTRPGAFLSGGMDSSSIVGLSAPRINQKLETFSFRCKGKSFDESNYAQIMSDEYGTNHRLVEFPPDEIGSISELVALMPEPFCDIGIEIASYLLAKNASQQVDYILSGDGGDELFAGHPVYIADKVGRAFDVIPGFIRNPVVHLLQYLPDTDKKKSLVVKAKRFSYSFHFSPSLYSNRWRIYYTPQELKKATNPEFWDAMKDASPLSDIETYYEKANGTDFLSKTLYGDYLTVVNFYMTRMYILRHFGIEARFPMFDHRLVEFAATIPSGLKIKGRNDTKYILKKTMAGVLPDSIVFRKDKLGHSVPMKNWMRENPSVRDLIHSVLSKENVSKRGFFKPEFVQQLIEEHMSKKCNHSHRIWALLVLELWLQRHFDRVENVAG